MASLEHDVAQAAAEAVEIAAGMKVGTLDYSEASLAVTEAALAEMSAYRMTEAQSRWFGERFGCYVLEVARRNHGGRYLWLEERDQPILVWGEPEYHVAMIAWDKVRGRLSGDEADSILFFYEGFAERIKNPVAGKRVVYV